VGGGIASFNENLSARTGEISMGKLLLVRHGHTHLNSHGKDERLRGWIDVPLDEEGLHEAYQTAGLVSGYRVEAIYCSDLRRARQTAEILRRQTKAPVTATGDLRPWNLGAFAGERVREIIPFLNLLNRRPELGAPGGESFYQFFERYATRLRALLELAEQSSDCIMAVTHVRNLLACPTIISDGDRDSVPVRGGPKTGSLVVLEKENGKWSMCSYGGQDVVRHMMGPATTPEAERIIQAQ
jgi:broad specificity phosphatase PhoE